MQAQVTLQQHQKGNGKLKGFGVKLFGLDLKTQARREAEAALTRAEEKKREVEVVARQQQHKDTYSKRLETQAREVEREALMRRNQLLQAFGTEKDMDHSERILENTIKKMVQQLDHEQVREAFINDEITTDHVRAFAVHSGSKELLEAIEQGWDKSPGL